MFQHDQLFTKTAVAKKSVEACGNIFCEKDLFNPSQKNKQRREKFFWTRNQRKLIEGDPKRVLFTSNYGTGKTLVMKAKAMQIARKRQFFESSKKTFDEGNLIDPGKTFIILFSKPDALLFHSIHQEFEELKDHVEVICYTG
jgi:hypothetical protein